jgi:hypothetical protein
VMRMAGGDRTHDRGIMRWERSVGIVRRCRIRSELKENLSGGFGLVRWRRFGIGMKRGIFESATRSELALVSRLEDATPTSVDDDHTLPPLEFLETMKPLLSMHVSRLGAPKICSKQ